MERYVKLISRGTTFLVTNTFASDVEDKADYDTIVSYEKRKKVINEKMSKIISADVEKQDISLI